MVKIIKRGEMSVKKEMLMRLLAVAAALAASAAILTLLGYNPFRIFAEFVRGATGTAYRLRQTIHKAIPLVVLSLGVGVAFRMAPRGRCSWGRTARRMSRCFIRRCPCSRCCC
jgi:simple sugar transport system permease protein